MPEYGLFEPLDITGLPQTTRSGIYYEVDVASYREAWVPGANRTVITARVSSEEAFDWITDMVGRVYYADQKIRRDLPEQNPFDQNQWCTKVEQLDQGGPRGEGTSGDPHTYRDEASGWPFPLWARYRCTFENMPFRMRDDNDVDTIAPTTTPATKPELLRYVTRTQRTYAREQQIPGGAFKIVDAVAANRLPLMQTGFKVRCYGDVIYTLARWPVSKAVPEWKTLRGKVNDAVFDPSPTSSPGEGYEWPAGELLYVGYDDNNKYFDANEDWVMDVILSFKFCQGGWNFFFNHLGELKEVSSDGTAGGTKPYSSGSLAELFEAP